MRTAEGDRPVLVDMMYQIAGSILMFAAVYLTVAYGVQPARAWLRRLEQAYDMTLRRRLLLDIEPTQAMALTFAAVLLAFVFGYLLSTSLLLAVVLAAMVAGTPPLLIRHLAAKRRQRLESQLVDGLSTLAAGARAGLNLVQSIDLLVQNHHGPIQQEFAQLKREYELGTDLDKAMRAASDRIGSPLYRLTFTAIEMHRKRGGNAAESLDRIADSIREIQRLEGKLDALTAQGRTQAVMMATMPLVFLAILYLIDRGGVMLLVQEPVGRVILLVVALMILGAFLWIRKILEVDI